MTTEQRLERRLPELLEGLYLGPAPDYRDQVLAAAVAERQRPSWTFPGRWLPMSAFSERMAAAPRVPWRAVGVLALLILALLAATILAGGRQQRRVPAPFGPAGNGVIPFVSGGDLYVGDPVTGETRLLEAGDLDTGNKAQPLFSPDGTRIAYIRDFSTGSQQVPVDIWVANADGTDRQRLNFGSLDVRWMAWTPDSQHLAVVHQEEGVGQLDVYDSPPARGVRHVAAAAGLDSLQFRPPDGRQILYRALVDGKYGLFVMDADGTNVRTLVEPTVPAEVDMTFRNAVYSADGDRIFYEHGTAAGCCQLWVMNADGSDPHLFVPQDSSAAWTGLPAVSPDGSRVAYMWAKDGEAHVAVAPVDGTGVATSTGPDHLGPAHWIWSPDSSKILMYPDDDSSPSAYLLDPQGGPWTTVPWESDGDLDWQRIAP